MSADRYELTDNPAQLCSIINDHALREEARLSYRRLMWILAWHYINGYRRFTTMNPNTGSLNAHFLDKDGNLEYQHQDLLSIYNRTIGQLVSRDYRPLTQAVGISLNGYRDRAVGQLVLDNVVKENEHETFKNDLVSTFALLGSAGIQVSVEDHPVIGLHSDFEVVHPTEVASFPSLGVDRTKSRGKVRTRVVPMNFLEKRLGKSFFTEEVLGKMEWWEQEPGMPNQHTSDTIGQPTGLDRAFGSQTYLNTGTSGLTRQQSGTIAVARIRELYLDGPAGTCSRYVAISGDRLLSDLDFNGLDVPHPLIFDRFYENHTFHGCGLFDLLFPICRELERLLKSLFNNIRDIDRYGFLVIPQGSYNKNTTFTEIGKGLRVFPLVPDPISENYKPFMVQPANSGDVPGKVAAFAAQMLQSISPDRDLIDEKGRVDSAAGLAFLDEAARKATVTASAALARMFGAAYKSTCSKATQALSLNPRPLPITRLDMNLTGVVIDTTHNTVTFPANPLPDVSRLNFGVKETNPNSEVQRKAEALDLLREGVTDLESFKIYSIKEGLNYAMYVGGDQAAIESVTLDWLTVFGDGVTPGKVKINSYTTKPEIQLRLWMDAMAMPIVRMASPDVQEALMDYRDQLLQWMGLTLPAAVPNPDDAALLSMPEPSSMVEPQQVPMQGTTQEQSFNG